MSRTTYAPKQEYLGNGTLNQYSFAFKIEEKTQLEVVVMNASGVETQRVRGDDLVYLSDTTFDSVNGGGSVTLQANLPAGETIILLLANDEPTQEFIFSNQLSFSLKRFEAALDWIVGAVQRLAYRSKQSIRIHDADDENTFNTQLPPDVAGNAGNFIAVNDTGDGFEYRGVNAPGIQNDINVIGVSQGRYNNGDVIPAGTDYEEIIRNMLTLDTPPVFTLAGNGSFLVETGTSINPTLTPAYIDNDAGPSNNYELRKNAAPIYSNAVPMAYSDGPFTIGDETITYEATVDYDADILPAGSIVSNTVQYRGARAAFFQVGGDAVNIRSNSETLVGVQAGSQLVTIGDGASLNAIFAYPDSLGDPTSLFLSNTGGNFDITSDLVREADQSVNDASGGNAITYRVYSYTALIAIKTTDTLTFTI